MKEFVRSSLATGWRVNHFLHVDHRIRLRGDLHEPARWDRSPIQDTLDNR